MMARVGLGRGTVRRTARRIIPAQRVPSVRLSVSFVQVERVLHKAVLLLADGFDLRNTAARLGHSGGDATTLRHYADPIPRWTGEPPLTSHSWPPDLLRHPSTLTCPYASHHYVLPGSIHRGAVLRSTPV
jgi:hypothetical protein